MKRFSSNTKYFLGVVALFIIFISSLPPNPSTKAQYNMTTFEYHILLFLVEIPLIAVWFAALFGYSYLNRYTRLIKKTAEGKDFTNITYGMNWLAWGLAAPSLISILLSAIANVHHGFHATSLVLANYLNLIMAIVAFSYVSSGTRMLAQRSKVYLDSRNTKRLTLSFVILGVVFCYLVIRNLHNVSLGDSLNAYYLPNWLVLTTLVIPYLYAWFIGLLAAFELTQLARRVSGVLYKQALQMLASGLVLVIVASSGLEYFRSVIPRTGHISIGPTLVAVYLIYAVTAAGYILVAMGARRLKRIEEV